MFFLYNNMMISCIRPSIHHIIANCSVQKIYHVMSSLSASRIRNICFSSHQFKWRHDALWVFVEFDNGYEMASKTKKEHGHCSIWFYFIPCTTALLKTASSARWGWDRFKEQKLCYYKVLMVYSAVVHTVYIILILSLPVFTQTLSLPYLYERPFFSISLFLVDHREFLFFCYLFRLGSHNSIYFTHI